MSTSINITVGGNSLVDQAKAQQQAARQAQLEKENRTRLEREAAVQRIAALAAQGRDANGVPISGSLQRRSALQDEPAATRTGQDETVSMSWIVVGSNSWYANIASAGSYNRALQTTYTGTNSGRSIYISSTDGTYWHSVLNDASLKAPAGFLPGEETSRDINNETYRLDSGINDYVFELFPVGKGIFIATFQFTNAYLKARWSFGDPVPTYTITLNQASPLTITYKSFLISKTSVKEIGTPQGVKNYFSNKFPGWIQTSRSLRRYTTGTVIEARTSPDPAKTLLNDWGSVTFYDLVQGSFNRPSRGALLWWLNGWWQNAMPAIAGSLTGRSALFHGSPAIFSRVAATNTNWTNYFNTLDGNGVVVNDFTSWFDWFVNSYAQDQTKLKKPIAYYLANYSSIYAAPMAIQLPLYQAIAAMPVGYQWYQGITPRIPPSDTSYWKPFKTLSFSNQAQAMPTVSAVTSNDSFTNGPDTNFCISTDWGNPSYCRSKVLELGFAAVDITP